MPRDFRAALARARQANPGTTGDTGDAGDNRPFPSGDEASKAVTSPEPVLVTVVPSPAIAPCVTSAAIPVVTGIGDAKDVYEQALSEPVTSVTSVTTENERVEERAAIMASEARMPDAWASAFAEIVEGPVRFPSDPHRWHTVVDGALVFADQWASKAHALGWTVVELFGLDPIAPAARLDTRGLAFLLGNSARVVAIDSAGADIVTAQGSRQRFYRKQRRAA